MEDAMIVNKAAVEHDTHASLYKTEPLVLQTNERFQGNTMSNVDRIHLYTVMKHTPWVRGFKASSIMWQVVIPYPNSYKSSKRALMIATSIKIKGIDTKKRGIDAEEANVTLRFNRNPIIGDKFSSGMDKKGVFEFSVA